MIVKKIPNPKKSAAKARRVVALGNYIAEPEKENGVEKCIHFQANNFLTDTRDAQLAEMVALASETRSADPVDHWVLSWRADERPTIEQAREAVEIFIRHCGLAEHQFMWGFHDDTDNLHCHIQVNRVHPDTLRVLKINKGFDREAGQQAAALIEHAQGWKPEKRSRYKVIDGKPVLRDSSKAKREQREPSAAAVAKEIQTGEKSAQRRGIEDAAPLIAAARSWRELHDNLNAAGMRYERKGSGATIFIGDQPIKASDVSRAASLSALQKRFGQFQPAKEISHNDYFHHTAQPYPAAIGEKFGHGLRNLSECRVATLQEGGQAKRAGILSFDAQPDRHGADGLRRSARSERGTGAAERDGSRARANQGLRPAEAGRAAGRQARGTAVPVKAGQLGWNEYQVIRAERKAAKESATTNLQVQQEAARDAMFERHKAERAELFSNRSWRGQGVARNAMLSLIATRHAAEKLELREVQKAERAALREQHPQLPQYKQWREQPQVVAEAEQIEVKPVQQPQLAALLRSLRQSPDLAGHFTYRSGNVALFRDEGKIIAVLNQDSRSLAAALAVAQSKFGQTLTLTGPHDFQLRAVRAAVEHGLNVKFKDPALEEMRLHLIEAKRQAERQAQAERAAAVAAERDERERAQPTTNQPAPQEPQPVLVQQPKAEPPAPARAEQDQLAEILHLAEQHRAGSDEDKIKPVEVADGKEWSKFIGNVVARNEHYFVLSANDKLTVHSFESIVTTGNSTLKGKSAVEIGNFVKGRYQTKNANDPSIGTYAMVDVTEKRKEQQKPVSREAGQGR